MLPSEYMWLYNKPTTITVLDAVKPKVPMTKVFTKYGSDSYTNAFLFDVQHHEVNSLEDYYELLNSLEPTNCIIRGKLKEGNSAKSVRRLIKNKGRAKALFEDQQTKLLHLDVDGVEAPEGVTMAQWAEYCISQLPIEFQGVSYIYQYSSSAGVKAGIRLHLWFYMALPVNHEELKRWYSHLTDHQQRFVDDAVFRPVQVNYVQPPIFKGGAVDPLEIDRVGLVERQHPRLAITIPDEALKLPVPLNTNIPAIVNSDNAALNAFHRKLWQIENSGRLHTPIFSAFSAYKWAVEKTEDIGEYDEEWCMSLVKEAISNSSHPDKDGVYSTEEYLDAQFFDAQVGDSGSGFSAC